jgi:glycolate oxidase FAD binding subunit
MAAGTDQLSAEVKIIEPENEHELAAALAAANRDGLAVLPRGGGTKMQWGNAPTRADVILSTKRMNRILEHAWADLTVTVQAGCTIHKLQQALAAYGQRLAIDPLWPEDSTVGGVLSTNDSGGLRLRYGGLRDLVIGVTLALPDGTLAMSGGKVVKNVAGYDLPKLVTGALGTLGVITKAVFRLHPLPKNVYHVTLLAADLQEGERLVMKMLDSTLVPAAVQMRSQKGAAPEIDVVFEGTEEGIASQMKQLWQMGKPVEGIPVVWDRMDADAKLSVLPSQMAETLAQISGEVVIHATGLGWIRQREGLGELRANIEKNGGSLTLLRHALMRSSGLDAWGNPGDALPLMREVKRQFDPKNTLNPGRFVGGI